MIHILNGAVGYRLDYTGRSVVFSGDTRPCHTLVDACDGTDLLIHETFRSGPVFAKKTVAPEDLAEAIVNGAHTSPTMVGKVFARAAARMSAMWHLAVDHETVGRAFSDMRAEHDGPVVLSQRPDRVRHQRACDRRAAGNTRSHRVARRWPHQRVRPADVRATRSTRLVGRRAPYRLKRRAQLLRHRDA